VFQGLWNLRGTDLRGRVRGNTAGKVSVINGAGGMCRLGGRLLIVGLTLEADWGVRVTCPSAFWYSVR
jgi:hypothetical protein